MNVAKWIIAGLVGGAVGAGVWAVVSNLSGYEFGLIAWVVGALVGLCVRKAAGDEADTLSGIVAAVVALASITAGKYASLYAVIEKLETIEFIPDPIEDWEACVATLASGLAEAREGKGDKLQWPEGVVPHESLSEAGYPADVWDEAARQWHAMSKEERAEYADGLVLEAPPDPGALAWMLLPRSMLSVFGAIFLVLGAATAFKLGGGFGS